MNVNTLFCAGGLLVRSVRDYREGQHHLAQEIQESFDKRRSGLFEAGTGIGKTYAYVAPAILAAQRGRRTVIAVHTNALLDQITSDIPTLSGIMGTHVAYAALKGRSRYVCNRAAGAVYQSLDRAQRAFVDSAEPDIDNYKGILSSQTRQSLSATADECRVACSAGCDYKDDESCHFYKARRAAMDANIVVTNFSLLVLNSRTNGRIFGEFAYCILDEAHALPDVIRGMYEDSVSIHAFDGALDRVRELGLWSETKAIGACVTGFFRKVHAYSLETSDCERDPRESLCRLEAPLALKDAVLHLYEIGHAHGDRPEREGIPARTDLRRVWSRIAAMCSDTTGLAVWSRSSRDVGHVSLHSAPVDVAPLIRRAVHSQVGTVVAVSATLCHRENEWNHAIESLAMPADCVTVSVPSPFDFATNALWYTPTDMPIASKRSEYNAAVGIHVTKLVSAAGGRTLVLCSALEDIPYAEKACLAAGVPVLSQCGGLPISELSRRFKAGKETCLVGSQTFGTGFDAPGATLQCVIMWRLPYQATTMVDEYLRREDPETWFVGHYYPRMLLTLRQWAGRLIRTSKDRGVIAIMDSAVLTGRYRQSVAAAMPRGIARTTSLDIACEFLRSIR